MLQSNLLEVQYCESPITRRLIRAERRMFSQCGTVLPQALMSIRMSMRLLRQLHFEKLSHRPERTLRLRTRRVLHVLPPAQVRTPSLFLLNWTRL